ncbi:hypothetical protein [Collimonas fungivorans]|uniref:hypothetical protein n=1 Tax=Collimonas fungivorans TaxID=158899 RepID=UPI001EE664E8|nr:hypothetical protein [Collimonas fungivorans]
MNSIELAADIQAFRFYDLRAKAADDTSDDVATKLRVIYWAMTMLKPRSGITSVEARLWSPLSNFQNATFGLY